MAKKHCETCGKLFNPPTPYHNNCDKCLSKPKQTILINKIIDRPDKQDPRYYKEKWFKRNDREWHADIKSRQTLPNGEVVRVTNKGEIIR